MTAECLSLLNCAQLVDQSLWLVSPVEGMAAPVLKRCLILTFFFFLFKNEKAFPELPSSFTCPKEVRSYAYLKPIAGKDFRPISMTLGTGAPPLGTQTREWGSGLQPNPILPAWISGKADRCLTWETEVPHL